MAGVESALDTAKRLDRTGSDYAELSTVEALWLARNRLFRSV
jgi:hypothetical protein